MAGALEIAKRALDELGFFSKALEEAKGAKMKSGTPQQWVNTLRKQGVKPAELEATGFNGLLMEQPNAQMAKDDVVKFLTDNRVKLAEPTGRKIDTDKLYYARGETKAAAEEAQREWTRAVASQSPDRDAIYERYMQAIEAREAADRAYYEAVDSASNTKFDKYTLPGGTNYAESRLTLEPRTLSNEERIAAAEKFAAANGIHLAEGVPPEMRTQILGRYMPAAQAQPLYRGSHWDEPDVLAHYRTKDRIGPNGERVLHVDEVQSDWAQAGRDQGFIDPKAEQQRRELRKQLNDATSARNGAHRTLTEYLKANHPEPSFDPFSQKVYGSEADRLWEARLKAMDADPKVKELQDALRVAQDRYHPINEAFIDAQKRAAAGSVNPGPFVTDTKDWTDLTLKRALLKAEREGYDAIALTPGVEQADRYDLSDRVGRIEYVPDGGYLTVRGTGIGTLHDQAGVKPEDLPGIIGKDNAERLLASKVQNEWATGHVLEPDDMTWGGEGMKAFYDRIVPERLNKLARQLDPEAALESMPAGRRLGLDYGDEGNRSPVRRVYAQTDMADAQAGNIDTFSREFPTLDEAEDYVQAHHWPRGGEIPQLPMLRLTPRMKEQLKQGLPLFVGAPAVAGGALSALDRQQAPAGNEFARGGSVQAQREGERVSARAMLRPEDRYLETEPNRYLSPKYDATVAGRPVGGESLVDLLEERGRVKGFADGGEADWGGWDNSGMSVDPWGGNVGQAIADAQSQIGSMEAAYGGGGDQSGMITDPNDPAAQYEPGMVAFNPEQSYADWSADYYGGSPAADLPASVVPDATAAGNFGMFGMDVAAPLSAGLPSIGAPSAMASTSQPAQQSSGVSFEGDLPTETTMSELASLSMPMEAPYAEPTEFSRDRDPYAEAMGPVGSGQLGFSGFVGSDAPPAASPYEVPGYIGAQPSIPGAAPMGWDDPVPDVQGVPSMAAFGVTPYGGAPLGPMSQKDAFLADFMPGAVGASRATGIDSRIIGAQGAHESAWGAKPSGTNNQLGMKGPGTEVATHEYVNGQRVNMTDSFRDFASPSKQFEFYSELMNRPAFADVGRQKTYEGQIEALDESPYATDPRYGAKVDAIAQGINPGLYDLAIRDIGSQYGSMGRAMRENAVPEFGSYPGSTMAAPASSRAAAPSDMMTMVSYAPQDAMPDVIGSMMSSPTAAATTPSYGREFYEPNQIGSGLGYSPFGAAGTAAFGPAMGGINPQSGGMLGATPSGLPSFVANDMASSYDRMAFGQPIGSTFSGARSAPAQQDTINGRPVDDYGFAGPAVAADSPAPRAPGYENPPIDVRTLPEPAPLPPERPTELAAPDDGPASSPRSPSMNERIAGWMGGTDRRNVDPLTRQVYDPVTGYTYPVDPINTGRAIDMVTGLIPGFGLVNGVSRLLGGPSVGGVMAQGAPGGWDALTAADGSDRSFGGSGADNRQAYYSAPIPAPAPLPPTSADKPMTNDEMLAYLRRRYLGEDADPKTYGMRAQRNYYSYE